jgi:hypothetical protein
MLLLGTEGKAVSTQESTHVQFLPMPLLEASRRTNAAGHVQILAATLLSEDAGRGERWCFCAEWQVCLSARAAMATVHRVVAAAFTAPLARPHPKPPSLRPALDLGTGPALPSIAMLASACRIGAFLS